MAQPIPPLLCNTPPPIDFDDGNDDDFGDFEGARTDYEGSLPASPRHEIKDVEESLELPPLPNDVEYPLYADINPPPPFETIVSTDDKNPPVNESGGDVEIVLNPAEPLKEENLKGKCDPGGDLESELNAIKLTETQVIITSGTINRSELKTEHLEKLSREDSPQSLDLVTTNLSDDEEDSIGEFQVASEAKYDDNTSLPSLKFDAIAVSKSTTPIFDEKANESKEQVDTVEINDSVLSALPSLISSQTNLQNKLETNATEADDDELEVSQDKSEELFAEFQQSNLKEQTDETNTAIVASVSGKNEEILSNETRDQSVIDDIESCEFDDFVLSKDVVVEPKTNIFSSGHLLTEISGSSEDIVLNNFSGFTFEADFSQFESADDKITETTAEPEKLLRIDAPTILPDSFENDTNTGDDDDFEDFQDFKTSQVQSAQDDDFYNFSEFDTTNQDSDRRDSFKLRNVDGKVKPILDLMFPEDPEGSEAASDSKDKARQDSQSCNNHLTTDLQEIDTAKALSYQWASSNVKHSLIKALGIDSRNILYGEKWNSSVPRFAANLVFNPLEPLRPVKIGGHSSTSSANQENRQAENPAALRGNVPEVEFDWNSSGLVNPLDGVKEIVCERKTKAIHSAKSGSANESIEQQATEKANSTQSNPSNTPPNLSNINNDLTNEPFTMQNFTNGEQHIMHQIIKSGSDDAHSSSTSTAFVFPLKETHIYTPSKLDSVPRHTKTEDKDPIDFDYKTAAAGIIIDEKVVKKEYRDVEYNPTNWNLGPLEEKYITNSNGPNTCTSNNFETTVDILSVNFPSLAEQSDDSKNTRVTNFSEDFSSFQYNLTRSNSNLKSNEVVLKPHEANDDNFESIVQTPEQSGPGKNDSGLDDDFSDFQSVPPPAINPIKVNNQMLKTAAEEKTKSRTGTPTFSDEMILSPAVLLPQAIKIESGPKIDWPEPGINPEELARIEELFPQSKNESKKIRLAENQTPTTAIAANDDDDWSDFVSVPATNQSNMSQTQPSIGGGGSAVKVITSHPNDDEWSDFVSSAPVQWNNSAMLSKYNAWNHPSTKTALNSHIPSQPSTQFQHKNNVPTNFYQRNHVNNNISQYLLHSNSVIADHRPNHFLPPQQEQMFHNTAQYQNQLQQDQSALKSQLNPKPSISLIPDLGFVAPRNLINIPRSAISKK